MDLEKCNKIMEEVIKVNIELIEKLSDRERDLAAERDKGTENKTQIMELMRNVSAHVQLNSDLKIQLDALGMELKQVKEDLKGKEKLHKKRKINLGIANYQCAKSNQQLDEYKKKFKKEEEELRSKIAEQDGEIVSQRNEISVLQMEIKNKLDETDQLTNARSELVNQNKELEKNLEKERKTCQSLQIQLQKKIEEASRFNDAVGESEKRKEEMVKQLLEYEERINILQEIARDKQSQCNAMQKFLEEDYTFIIDQERNRISLEEARSQKFRNFMLTLNSENFGIVPVQDSGERSFSVTTKKKTSYVKEEKEKVEPSTSASSGPHSTKSTTQQCSTCTAEPFTPAAPQNWEGSLFPHVDVEDSDEESYEKDQTQARAETPSHSTHIPFCDSDVSNFHHVEQLNQKEDIDGTVEAQPSPASSSAFCNTKKASARSSQIHGVDHSKRCNCLCGRNFQGWSTLKSHIKYFNPQHTFLCGETGCNKVFSGTSYLRKHMEKDHNLKYTKSGCSGCGKTFKSFPELRAHQNSKSCWATMDAPEGGITKCRKTFRRKRRTRLSQKKNEEKKKKEMKQTKPTTGRNSPKQCQTLPKLYEVTVTLTDCQR